MKKSLALFTVILLILSLSACQEPTARTEHFDDYVYSVGEEISVYDKESSSLLGTVTVTGVTVVRNEPFELEKIVDFDENDQAIYENVPYEAVVQIDYVYDVADSTNKITASNFIITDCEDNLTERSPEIDYAPVDTDDDSIFVAVKEKGEFVNLKFMFHTSQKPIAYIKAVYDGYSTLPETDARPSYTDDYYDDEYEYEDPAISVISGIFAGIFLAILFLSPVAVIVLIIVIVSLSSKNRHLNKLLQIAQNGAVSAPPDGNNNPVYPYPPYPPQPSYPYTAYPVQYPPINVPPKPTAPVQNPSDNVTTTETPDLSKDR